MSVMIKVRFICFDKDQEESFLDLVRASEGFLDSTAGVELNFRRGCLYRIIIPEGKERKLRNLVVLKELDKVEPW